MEEQEIRGGAVCGTRETQRSACIQLGTNTKLAVVTVFVVIVTGAVVIMTLHYLIPRSQQYSPRSRDAKKSGKRKTRQPLYGQGGI